jgi:hypothetical protein
LAATSVDGIRVQDDVVNFNLDAAHVFFSHHTFFRRPLEGSDARILNFVHVLNPFTHVDDQVRTSGVRTKAPDLLGQIFIPVELFR